jgi:hypothetical protein
MSQSPEPQKPVRVVVTDLDISFGHLVQLLLKLALALIPAALILGITGLFAFLLVTGLVTR